MHQLFVSLLKETLSATFSSEGCSGIYCRGDYAPRSKIFSNLSLKFREGRLIH